MEENNSINEIDNELEKEQVNEKIEKNEIKEETKLTNYYVFEPFAFVCKEKQADKNWIFICLEWSIEDRSAKLKKWFELSKYIRDLGFISKGTLEKLTDKILSKAETLKTENEELKTIASEQKLRADKSELDRAKEVMDLKTENEELKKQIKDWSNKKESKPKAKTSKKTPTTKTK